MWVWLLIRSAQAIPDSGLVDTGIGGGGGTDNDGDGYGYLTDCNDDDGTIYPGAFEGGGDGIDQNCDGDETCYRDNDGDGARTSSTLHSADLDCDDGAEAYYWEPIDCNDNNSGISPYIYDIFGDGIDSNCDGLEVCFGDMDNDGATDGVVLSADLDCNDPFEGTLSDPYDCNDFDASIFPGASEAPGDSTDQNCDNRELCFTDADNDGARLTSTFLTSSGDTNCTGANEGGSADPIDCADNNAAINPGATELAADNIDSNCDSRELCYTDADNDGARLTSTFLTSTGDTSCTGASEGLAADPIDCNDADASARPGAAEITGDGVDQSCDGVETCFDDADNDGNRHNSNTRASLDIDCSDTFEALASEPVDCDDTDAQRFVGNIEVVSNGVDNDCSGGEICYADGDNDGARHATSTVTSADVDCLDANEGMSADLVDCIDNNAAISPGATEIPGDNFDQNCDDRELCFTDADDDGARVNTTFLTSLGDTNCTGANEGATADAIDCDDTSPAVRPGATELTGDGTDSDCDGGELCWADGDGDGARSDTATTLSSDADCSDALEATLAAAIDCDDTSPESSPGNTEVSADGIDNDCDGIELCYVDADADGTRSSLTVDSIDLDCEDPFEASTSALMDCDDLDPAVSPLAPELCDNIDNDCDDTIDFDDCDQGDIDSDGLSNEDEATLCADQGLEPSLCSSDPDLDGDAVIDSIEVGPDISSPLDTDADGRPDFLDPDDEDDTITTRVDNNIPCDGDLSPIYEEALGYWTFSCMGTVYDFGGNELSDYPDADGDAVPNFLDADDDGDGTPTSAEWTGDVDCDETENWLDANDTDGPCYEPPETTDTGLPITDTTVDPTAPIADTAEGVDTGEELLDKGEPAADPETGASCGCQSGTGRLSLLGALIALLLARSRRR